MNSKKIKLKGGKIIAFKTTFPYYEYKKVIEQVTGIKYKARKDTFTETVQLVWKFRDTGSENSNEWAAMAEATQIVLGKYIAEDTQGELCQTDDRYVVYAHNGGSPYIIDCHELFQEVLQGSMYYEYLSESVEVVVEAPPGKTLGENQIEIFLNNKN